MDLTLCFPLQLKRFATETQLNIEVRNELKRPCYLCQLMEWVNEQILRDGSLVINIPSEATRTINPLLPTVTYMARSVKNLSLIWEGNIKNFSYERREYESILGYVQENYV